MKLSLLEEWFVARCNGNWEHGYDIRIETLDNPGWRVKIDLRDTPKEAQTLEREQMERTESNWVQCWTEDRSFHIACGPMNLSEALEKFLTWFNSK